MDPKCQQNIENQVINRKIVEIITLEVSVLCQMKIEITNGYN